VPAESVALPDTITLILSRKSAEYSSPDKGCAMETRTFFILALHGLLHATGCQAAMVAGSLSEIGHERRLITGTAKGLTDLLSGIAQPGLTITNAAILRGHPNQVGLFTGGSDSIGLASGLIMSTGSVGNVTGPNKRTSTTTQFGGTGYSPLHSLIPSDEATEDAAVLQIDFVCDSGKSEEFHLEYVWASEEYNEYVSWCF
jgi:hypothetical protein